MSHIAVAGHVQKIKFSNREVLKETGKAELEFYQKVFGDGASTNLIAFRPFIPKFFSGYQSESSKGAVITLENIMQGLSDDYLSIIDIKLGTSSITMRCRQGQ